MSSQSEIEQTKIDVINSLPEDCRTIGKSFFDCLEKHATEGQTKNFNEKQYESFMVETAMPECLKEYNLDECLQKNSK